MHENEILTNILSRHEQSKMFCKKIRFFGHTYLQYKQSTLSNTDKIMCSTNNFFILKTLRAEGYKRWTFGNNISNC